jgi:hypothetical protein
MLLRVNPSPRPVPLLSPWLQVCTAAWYNTTICVCGGCACARKRNTGSLVHSMRINGTGEPVHLLYVVNKSTVPDKIRKKKKTTS